LFNELWRAIHDNLDPLFRGGLLAVADAPDVEGLPQRSCRGTCRLDARNAFQQAADVRGLFAVKVFLFQRGDGLRRVDGDLGGACTKDDAAKHLEEAVILLRGGGVGRQCQGQGGGEEHPARGGVARRHRAFLRSLSV
jgi:hypothetical protein